MTCGVYLIRRADVPNGYVGSSRDIQRRFRGHVRLLEQGEHHAFKLQAAWDKYGPGSFRLQVLEICPEWSLRRNEVAWIERLDSYRRGYNSTPLGAGPDARTRRKIAAANRKRKDTGKILRREAQSEAGRKRRSLLMQRLNYEGKCGWRNPLARRRALRKIRSRI